MAEHTPLVIGVRFSVVGKIYHFDASKVPDLRMGDSVVVETTRGWQLGQVAQVVDDPELPPDGEWKMVDRRATPRDLLLRQSWQNREFEVVATCRARAKELRLEGVKIVAAEYSFDGARLAIMFSTENEDKVDLKSLRSEMQKMYGPSQVEMRQIGPRDVAKILGGMGACGLETRCCSKFLTDFSSISIRMAKEQGISLTPTEITGMCGRLRCCLIYEYEQYVAARATLPKRNKRVITPQGEGKVVDIFPLRESVMVELPEVGYREFTREEIKPADEYEAFQKKAAAGCGEENGQGCTCGKREGERREDAPADSAVAAEKPSPSAQRPTGQMHQGRDQRGPRREGSSRPSGERPSGDRPGGDRPGGDRSRGQPGMGQRQRGPQPGPHTGQQPPNSPNQPGEEQQRRDRNARRNRRDRRDRRDPGEQKSG